MNKFNIDGLLALNLEEIKIVFLRCRGETVEETAEYLKIGASTIYKWMPGICELLGLSSWKEIDEELCVTLRRIVPDVRALDAGWPEAFREKIEALREPKEPVEPPLGPKVPLAATPSSSNPTKPNGNTEKTSDVSSRTRIAWPLIAIPLVILGLLCIAGLIFGGSLLGNFLNRTQAPPASETSVPLVEDTSAVQPSPTVQLTDTAILLPTETIAPTSTFTPTSTLTLTVLPTNTKPPIGLVKGDELSDNRVTLKLTDIQYNQKYDRIGAKVAPISFFFDFTNHSGETIVLQFDSGDFQAVDNTGYEADCWFYHISGAGENVNEPLNNGDTREIVARCGLGNLNPNVTTVTLTVHPFTSLPESTWVATIPR